MANGMKIVRLEAENFKRLKAVQIDPTGNIIQVSGANEQGKTSVLDAIWAALGGAEMTKATGTVKALRNGQEAGFVRLDLGELIVTRKWTESGSTVTVENAEGAKFGSPQKILDGLVARVAIDPLSFASMPEKAQRETLLKIINLEIDLDKSTAYRKGAFDRRTDLNRNIKLLESQLVGLPEVPKETPGEEINQSSIMDEIAASQKILNSNNEIRRKLSENEINTQNLRAEIKRAETVLADLKAKLDAAGMERIDLDNASENLVDPNMSIFKARLEQLEEINKNVRIKKQSDQICLQIDGLRKQVEEQESKMGAIDKEKSDALDKAKFPIEGLSISDDGVTYKDVPFSQCSSAERLRVSVAIAMSMNPKLKVIRITDGSLIDSKNMAIIQEMASKGDWQIWIERVDESGKVGVFIEDGEVSAVN